MLVSGWVTRKTSSWRRTNAFFSTERAGPPRRLPRPHWFGVVPGTPVCRKYATEKSMFSSETPQTERRKNRVALVGNPNTGKTTLFNVLTGFRQHVGNYPGVTVDRKTGDLRSALDHPPIEIVDLPGAYSLSANSADEAVVLDVLMGQQSRTARPDLVLIVADASHLSRNLFLVSQVVELGIPVVVAINMIDLAESSGIHIDIQALARDLHVPVVPVVATKQQGIDRLVSAISDSLDTSPLPKNVVFPECVTAELNGLHDLIARADGRVDRPPSRIELLQTLLDVGGFHERRLSRKIGETLIVDLTERRNRIKAAGESVVEVEARTRYALIDALVERVVTSRRGQQTTRTEYQPQADSPPVHPYSLVGPFPGSLSPAIPCQQPATRPPSPYPRS